MKWVALTGVAGSGKSTVAQVLRDKYSYYLANFTDQIKEILAVRLGITVEEIQQNKRIYRAELQHLATFYGFDAGGYWVLQALDRSGWSSNPEHPVVFDNVRTDEQALTLAVIGIPIVKIVVDQQVALGRLGKDADPSFLEHPVERGVSPRYIYQIVGGECSPEEVAHNIVILPGLPTPSGISPLVRSLWSVPAKDQYSDETLRKVLGRSPSARPGR